MLRYASQRELRDSSVAGIRFSRLVNDFVATLERLSATVIRQNEVDHVRPARMRVLTGGSPNDCLVYLWAVTPGGKNRAANERRVQATGLQGDRIPLVPGVRTLLGGWNAEAGVWCFWDPRRHIDLPQRASNSLQVAAETLETAHRIGLATQLRPARMGSEVVVAVAPDSMLWYVQNGLLLHNSDEDSAGVEQLVDATMEEEASFIDESQDEIQTARRFDLVQLMRAYRDAKFRPAVLRAYRYRCAVCQCALKLVDAAHIVPVSYPQSTDEITNGLALCRLHHGAYDSGLLGIRSDYSIITNTQRESVLAQLDLHNGLDAFKAALPARITVPAQIEIRPEPGKLLLGLHARRWPADLVA